MRLIAAAMLLIAVDSAGEEADNFGAPINYIYANYFGSGIYETSSRSVTVINIPLDYGLGLAAGYPLYLRYSIAMGFFDLSYQDIHDLDLPTNFDTLSFTLGLEYRVSETKNNKLIPYVDVGMGRNFTNDEGTLLYSIGLSDLYTFKEKHLWATRLTYAGYQSMDYEDEGHYASLQTGLDLHTPWEPNLFNRELYTSVYGAAYWYFDQLYFRLPESEPEEINNSYEVGLTVGLKSPIDMALFDITCIGIGYRFSKDITAWRLVFGLPI